MSTDAAIRFERLARLRGAMGAAGVSLVAVAPTDSLRWLLGFAPLYDERACLLLVSVQGTAMLMPALNAEQLTAHAPEIELVRWADEDGPAAALTRALERVGAAPATVAADPEMRADHLLALQAAVSGAPTIDATALLGPLREIKDAGELAALARSAAVADRAVRTAWATCRVGVSEREVAEAVSATFREGGCTPEFGIVGAGANSAYPHHETGDRRLSEGDAVVIDVGAILDGYHSDITRMAFLGEPSDRYRKVHGVVEAAVGAAMAATRAGATCGAVDAAARGVISDAGYGQFFVHRTGHGLGLSGHEGPYVMDGSSVVLRAGMVHSIEPGIYLPGEFGIRLEEIVQVTDVGCERFSELARDVHVVA